MKVKGLSIILTVVLVSACNGGEMPEKPKIKNPRCEDLGKITDEAEHAALWAKCPDYLSGGAKKSNPKEW
jgi:entry exclusion lipoprotein TrbK